MGKYLIVAALTLQCYGTGEYPGLEIENTGKQCYDKCPMQTVHDACNCAYKCNYEWTDDVRKFCHNHGE